jgi:DNA-binding XRE family transcriptional regulator
MSDEDLTERRERLRRELRDNTEYREQYADSTLTENVSAQVQALRRQRGLTQEDLARKIGTKQPRISNIEVPPEGDDLPNWEVATLNRVAHALGTRLKITFETYGSLVEELGAVSSDSLRRAEPENDPVLSPRPETPPPDRSAPERTQWMQKLMIPWLWEEKLDIGRLIGWLGGEGLPPVGYDEEPYHWLLRGIAIPDPRARKFLETRLAERLAIVLGEEPDVHPLMEGDAEEFLVNLYWTCAGLNLPSSLGEQLWQAYKRLRITRPSGAVCDALQAAMVQNQFGETKPLKEIWEPMIEKGRHPWLRGNEIVGFAGILARHRTVKPDIEKVFWALGRISHRWKGTPEDRTQFSRLIRKVPDLDKYQVARKLIGWSEWATKLLPAFDTKESEDGSLEIRVDFGGATVFARWPAKGSAVTSYRRAGSMHEEAHEEWGSGRPNLRVLLNALLTSLGGSGTASEAERTIAHTLAFEQRT